ncbi:MAG: choice-of-anchor D domain-containing protein, partial [Calditrichaeota bacterium]|nr:choice-of-anchor D domain-containing protein [Calditrichota bacterium]
MEVGMLRVRLLSLAVLLLAMFVVVAPAAADQMTQVAPLAGLDEETYLNQVIFPAKLSPAGLSPEQDAWYSDYLGRQARGGGVLPRRDRRGVDNADNYSWRDRNEAGVEFNWIDIRNRQGAQAINLGDDQVSGVMNLGFNFNYYGQNYSSLRVCSNGWVSFDANYGNPDYPMPQPPNAGGVNSVIIMMGYDLHPGYGGTEIWFWSDGQGLAVVTYHNISAYGNNAIRHTAQLVINGANGHLKIQYGPQQGAHQGSINVGFESPNGQVGASIIFRNGSVADGDVFEIANRWIMFDGPGIVLNPEALNFGDVYVGQEGVINVTLTNAGSEELVITGWGNDNGAFVLPEFQGEFAIASGEEIQFDVAFRPEQDGGYEDTGWISSNAVNADENGNFFVGLTGRGISAPQIAVDPQAIEDELSTGETNEHIINIANGGGSDLNFEISHAIIREPGQRRDASGRELRNADGGPRRDNPGDVIAQYQGPFNTLSGMGFDPDNQWMWGSSYGQGRIGAVDMEGNVVRNFGAHGSALGFT